MKLLEVGALSGDPRRPLLHAGKHVRKAAISRGEHRHTAVRVNANRKPPSLTHLQDKRDRLTSERDDVYTVGTRSLAHAAYLTRAISRHSSRMRSISSKLRSNPRASLSSKR